MVVNDPELDRDFAYFLCGYYFGWVPEQVDRMEYCLIERLLTILPAWIKKTQEVKEK